MTPPRPDPRNNWPFRTMVYFIIQNTFIPVLNRKLNIAGLFFRIDWETQMAKREQPSRPMPLIGNDSYGGQEHVSRFFFSKGCFNHSPCSFCGSNVRLTTYVKLKKDHERGECRCITTTLRCKNKTCQKTSSPFTGTIWTEINDRQLFLFVVCQFLGRCTVRSISDSTGSKDDTISKYMKIIKNALYLENEEEKRNIVLGGRGAVVQGDESHVFARKYDIGRVLAITEHGWLFGMVEDGPDGRIWIEMVKDRSGSRLRQIITAHTATGTVVFTDSWKAYVRLLPAAGNTIR